MNKSKLITLAHSFEQKLAKQTLIKRADEVADTGLLSSIISPVVNNMLADNSWGDKFQRAFDKASKSGDWLLIGGDDLHPGHFFTTARLVKGLWSVIAIPGEGVSWDGTVKSPEVVGLVAAFNTACRANIAAQLNRMKANIQGDAITKHDVLLGRVGIGLSQP